MSKALKYYLCGSLLFSIGMGLLVGSYGGFILTLGCWFILLACFYSFVKVTTGSEEADLW